MAALRILLVTVNTLMSLITMGFTIYAYSSLQDIFMHTSIQQIHSIKDVENIFNNLGNPIVSNITNNTTNTTNTTNNATLPYLLLFNINPVHMIGIVIWLTIYLSELFWVIYSVIYCLESNRRISVIVLLLNIISNVCRIFLIYLYYNTWLILIIIVSGTYTLLKHIQLLFAHRNVLYLMHKKDKIFIRIFLENGLGIAIFASIIELLFSSETYISYYNVHNLNNREIITIIAASMYVWLLMYYFIDVVYFREYTKYTITPYISIILFYVYILILFRDTYIDVFYIILCIIVIISLFKTIRKLLIMVLPNPKNIKEHIKEKKIEKKLKKNKKVRKTDSVLSDDFSSYYDLKSVEPIK